MADLDQASSFIDSEEMSFDAVCRSSSFLLGPARRAFHLSCQAIAACAVELRPAVPLSAEFRQFFAAAAQVLPSDELEAQQFFRTWFTPKRVCSKESVFLTGYYEPEIAGRLEKSADFSEPILSRPNDLISFAPGECPLGAHLSAGRRTPDGRLAPYPARKDIENGEGKLGVPIVWVQDAVEAFKIHVQGSARIRLADGTLLRLTYAGRNGRPYTSVGRRLVAQGAIDSGDMSPERVYAWVRDNGLEPGRRGRDLLQSNESYIFFQLNSALRPDEGPIGAASVPLTPLASLAIDRTIWPYGLPYWISGSWTNANGGAFAGLLVGQDTGAAIVGPGRGDIFFGSGDAAGLAAGQIRHAGEMVVLIPNLSRSTRL